MVRRHARGSAGGLLLLTLLMPLSACSNDRQSSTTATGDWRVQLDQAIKEAETQRTQPQVEILRDIKKRDGAASYDDVTRLLPAFVSCIEGLGYSYAPSAPDTKVPGFPVLQYQVTGPDSDSPEKQSELISSCDIKSLRFVNAYYQTQPAFVQAYQADVRSHLPDIISCLRDHGVAIDDDAGVSEALHGIVDNQDVDPEVSSCYAGDIQVD